MRKLLLAVFLLLASGAGAEDLDIDVIGLFKDAALLQINGNRHFLRTGELSPEGVRLLKADSREALIQVGAEKMKVNLSTRIGTDFKPMTHATATVAMDRNGRYETTGSINDQTVAFVIDTGANTVAISSRQASALGIDYKRGPVRLATTASGAVRSWQVTLDSVQLGDIRVPNVPAAVLEGNYPQKVLLGMTFLRFVDIKQGDGTIQLRSKLQ